ncbi:maltose ABC transporter membrane protein /trehalose ABC transporter membrane protein [Rhizobiales bacterium GAS113]|nr:maltose ABC transporter membrane protein /trehalose ABC transporter membrane protein [Rhizobiales bacterium GAS113]SEF07472.1 maltose ABC transporter membrane protein /trehalose ABC transporter membrane protein [Rhizobiales bacterium GAS188]
MIRLRRFAGHLGFGLLVAVILAVSLFPFYYAVLSSLRQGSSLYEIRYWVSEPSLANYVSVFREQPFALSILNSLAVATGVVTISLLLGVTAAYALGRVDFKGRRLLLLCILSVSMFPQVAVLAGIFEFVRGIGAYNTIFGVAISHLILTLPFTVWVLTTFMRDLPKEVEEAAFVDGARPWVVVTRIFLPLLWPALVTTGLLAFITAWNEFLFSLTLVLSAERRTVPVAIALISGASTQELPWGNIMAASVTVTVPLILLVLVFQQKIVSGLTAGAVKG